MRTRTPTLIFSILPALAAAVFGCAAPSTAEETKRSSARIGDGITGDLTQDALYLEEQGDGVVFSPSDNIVTVCKNHVTADIWNSVTAYQDRSVQVVFLRADGSVEPRQTQPIKYINTDPMCRGQGPGYTLNLKPALNAEFFNLDMTKELLSGFGGARFACDGGLELSEGIRVHFANVRYENGALTQPELAVSFDGHVQRGAKLKCTATFDTSDRWILIGGVPVLYRLTAGVGIELKTDLDTHVSGELGTRKNEVSLTAPPNSATSPFEISVQLEVGLVLYHVIGGVIGMDVLPHIDPACPSKLDVGVRLKAAVQAGLLSAGGTYKTRQGKDGEITTTKAIGAEIATPELGPFPVIAGVCGGGAPPGVCGRCQGFDQHNAPVERECGESVCAGDGMMWTCTERGFEGTATPCPQADPPPPPPDAPCMCDGFDDRGEAVRRSCGESVCAGDGMMWTCTERGFEGTTTPCQ